MAEKKYYNNKNGNLSIEEWITLMHTEKIDQFMRNFKTSENPCPPVDLIPNDVFCFYCVSCMKNCISQVKEYKTYYQVKGKKYTKVDLDKMKEKLDEDR